MRSWRDAFAERATIEFHRADFANAVDRWRDESLTAQALPVPLQGRWVETLKSQVRGRLEKWFEANDIAAPPDLVGRSAPAAEARDDTDQLRTLVIRCVQAMTRTELEELRLPPAVVLRARR
jgi:hypothetical protein